MTVLKILQYPDPRLKTIAKPVEHFDDQLRKIIDDMCETFYATENCAALAATQLDIVDPPRVTVINFPSERDELLCLVNPEIIASHGEQNEEEGCMSVPGCTYHRVKRAMTVTMRAKDRNDRPMEFTVDGYWAKCVQHEIDHLNGKIFLDRLS